MEVSRMKNRFFYPAIFHKAEEGGFGVSFPDIPECLTQGDNIQQAYEMAMDALGFLWQPWKNFRKRLSRKISRQMTVSWLL